MKGALGILAISFIIWGFWMSWEWLTNRRKDDKKVNNNNNNNN
jgi:hypothetical protein